MKTNTKRVVVCAAICNKDGKIVAGARHYDSVMRGQILQNGVRPPEWFSAEQGFIDQFGIFMTRKEAWKVAEDNNQIIGARDSESKCLTSEDLY